MNNKYFYLFLKDGLFRAVCILSVIGVIFCVLLLRLNVSTSLALKDILVKEAIIDHIPIWQSKITNMKVVSNGFTFTLNGIILNNDQPIAIINNTIVKLGGKIEGKKVIIITKLSATLCDVGSPDHCIMLMLEQ